MYCSECGNQLEENVSFCDKCGANTAIAKKPNLTNILAVIGLILAGVSLLLNFWGIVGIAAVILSSLGLVQISKTGEKGKGIAIAGISIGAFSIVYAFAVIILLN